MNLTDADIDEILRLLDGSPYDELSLETDQFKLTLSPAGQTSWIRKAAGTAVDLDTGESKTTKETPAASSSKPASPATGGDLRNIYPPLPGTFYRAPSPGAEPFTDAGQTVDEETVVGLVETMKLMNSVMAGCTGEVVEICVENGTMVDIEDVLMRIKTGSNG